MIINFNNGIKILVFIFQNIPFYISNVRILHILHALSLSNFVDDQTMIFLLLIKMCIIKHTTGDQLIIFVALNMKFFTCSEYIISIFYETI